MPENCLFEISAAEVEQNSVKHCVKYITAVSNVDGVAGSGPLEPTPWEELTHGNLSAKAEVVMRVMKMVW